MSTQTQTISGLTEYEHRVVAFLDIMGWREIVERSQSDPSLIEKLGSSLTYLKMAHELPRSIEDWVRSRTEAEGKTFDPTEGRLQFAQFSDSIVLSGTRDQAFALIFQISGLLRVLFYSQGFVVRGAITSGLMFHKGNIAFGPALTLAYDLEQKLADFPRVILDSTLYSAQSLEADASNPQSPTSKWFRKSSDGLWFFDYLYPLLHNPDSFLEASNGSVMLDQFVRPNLNYARNLITERLTESARGSRKEEKYLWLARYFNEVTQEFKDADIATITIEDCVTG